MMILMREKGFTPIILLLIVLVICGLIVGAYYLGSTGKLNPSQNKPQIQINQSNNLQQSSKNQKFQLIGSEVIRNTDGQKSVLFKNVTGISEVRLGPDGRTLHFKIASFDPVKPQALCADLESEIRPLPSDYGSDPPPITPPWDYQKIAHAFTINHCNTYHAGGYLKKSGYFVYLKLTTPTQGQLYYENLKTGEVKQVSITKELLPGFNDGYKAKGTAPGKINSHFVDAVTGEDGAQYFYPQQDSYLQNNYLVLALGKLIIAVDLQKNSFIGGFAQGGVIANSFYFLYQESLPFIVVESGWEVSATFNEIIDLSNGNPKIVNLFNLDRRPLLDFEVEPIVWETDSILFNFTDIEDIEIPKDFLKDKDLINMKDADIKNLSKELEGILSGEGKYQQVVCDLHLGMYTPRCEGLKKVSHYKYTSKNGLQQI